MNKLLKYWEANKRKILITIGVIALVFICIRIANQLVKQQNASKKNEIIQNSSSSVKDVTKPNEAIISDTKLNEQQTEENAELIKQFVEYCNQKQIQKAYELISQDCRTELYANEQYFANNYINQIFTNAKNYQLELWAEKNGCYTYKITYNEGNPLQTGGYTSNNFIDYITIVKEGENQKLNISNFVNKEQLNKSGVNNNVEVQVNSRSIYTDYEVYNITVTNNTEKTILLNDGKSPEKFCLLDKNDNQYHSLIHEVAMSSLTINAKYTKTFKLKFNKMYYTSGQIQYMQLEDIYLDKEQLDLNQTLEVEKTTVKIKL